MHRRPLSIQQLMQFFESVCLMALTLLKHEDKGRQWNNTVFIALTFISLQEIT